VRSDLPDLVARAGGDPGIEDLALTTNASLLAGQAGALRAAGLRRLTVSLDALDPERVRRDVGRRGDLTDVLAGIDAAGAPGSRGSSSTASCSAA
jgi:cyclic pyranopterin phosphate synthase